VGILAAGVGATAGELLVEVGPQRRKTRVMVSSQVVESNINNTIGRHSNPERLTHVQGSE
jgi:hypothetical protein